MTAHWYVVQTYSGFENRVVLSAGRKRPNEKAKSHGSDPGLRRHEMHSMKRTAAILDAPSIRSRI